MFSLGGRPLRSVALLAVAALALAACASSNVSRISGASPDEIGRVGVSSIDVAVKTAKPNPALQAALIDELRKATDACATGAKPHAMKVTITDFEDQNVAKSILVGDEIELGGRVELFDDATGALAGEYFVQRNFFWMGIHGAVLMSDAEASLSEDFAASVCEEVFGRELEDKS